MIEYYRDCLTLRNDVYLIKPDHYTELSRLREADRNALHYIERLQKSIDTLKEYRAELMERAQFLAFSTPALSVELHRHRYDKSISYELQIVETFPDGSRRNQSRTTYAGKERHKAIADYKAACKAHPGAPCVLDIEKSKWER